MCLLCECLHRNVPHVCCANVCRVVDCVTHFYQVGGYAARVEQIGTNGSVPNSPPLEEEQTQVQTLTFTPEVPWDAKLGFPVTGAAIPSRGTSLLVERLVAGVCFKNAYRGWLSE